MTSGRTLRQPESLPRAMPTRTTATELPGPDVYRTTTNSRLGDWESVELHDMNFAVAGAAPRR